MFIWHTPRPFPALNFPLPKAAGEMACRLRRLAGAHSRCSMSETTLNPLQEHKHKKEENAEVYFNRAWKGHFGAMIDLKIKAKWY